MLGGDIYEINNTITKLVSIYADEIQGTRCKYYENITSNIQDKKIYYVTLSNNNWNYRRYRRYTTNWRYRS